MDNNVENIDTSELRRKTRATLERNALSPETDKTQLKDIMLFVLIGLAAVISMTDFSLSWGTVRDFTALTVFLYIITTLVYQNRYERGKNRGRSEEVYTTALDNYRKARNAIYEKNLASKVSDFCKEYKVRELREYRESLLVDLDISYEEYKDKYMSLSWKQIFKSHLPYRFKKILWKANMACSIKLAPGMILNESGEISRKRLLGLSGQGRERIDKRFNAISRIVITLFSGVIAIDIIMDFSMLTVAQWCIRMIPIIAAVIMADDSGYCNVVVTETNFKNNQISVIKLFEEHIRKSEPEEEKS